jgi:hypothetical protein
MFGFDLVVHSMDGGQYYQCGFYELRGWRRQRVRDPAQPASQPAAGAVRAAAAQPIAMNAM